MQNYQDLVVFQKTYDLALWLHPVLNRFPKSQKFALGQQIDNKILSIIRKLIEANKEVGIKRGEILKSADIELNELMVLFRLAKDLRFVNVKNYGVFAERAVEIGRLLGGWQRSLV